MGKVLEELYALGWKGLLTKLVTYLRNNMVSEMDFFVVDAIEEVIGITAEAVEDSRWKGGKKEYYLIVTLDIKNAFNSDF